MTVALIWHSMKSCTPRTANLYGNLCKEHQQIYWMDDRFETEVQCCTSYLLFSSVPQQKEPYIPTVNKWQPRNWKQFDILSQLVISNMQKMIRLISQTHQYSYWWEGTVTLWFKLRYQKLKLFHFSVRLNSNMHFENLFGQKMCDLQISEQLNIKIEFRL